LDGKKTRMTPREIEERRSKGENVEYTSALKNLLVA
jgi:hypothetical protein